jgi:hypothetical protein
MFCESPGKPGFSFVNIDMLEVVDWNDLPLSDLARRILGLSQIGSVYATKDRSIIIIQVWQPQFEDLDDVGIFGIYHQGGNVIDARYLEHPIVDRAEASSDGWNMVDDDDVMEAMEEFAKTFKFYKKAGEGREGLIQI